MQETYKDKFKEFRGIDVIPVDFLKECFELVGGKLFWRLRPMYHFKSPGIAWHWNGRYAGKAVGAEAEGRINCALNFYGLKKQLRVHRIIVALELGYWPENPVAHKNVPSPRVVTSFELQRNSRKHRDNKSGFKGTSSNGTGWRAQIMVAGRSIQLGTFETRQLAHEAYCRAARLYHKDYANFG